MSVNSIFPILSDMGLSDLQEPILQLFDNKSLVSLSCTQKYAYSVFDNGTFFKDRFMELYKLWHPNPEKLFPHFHEVYPDCSWKICSCLYPNANPIVVFNKTFLREALPYADQMRQNEIQKSNLEEELQNICGIRFADPNSRIHQLWQSYQAARESNAESIHTEERLFAEYTNLDKRRIEITDSIWKHKELLDSLREPRFLFTAYRQCLYYLSSSMNPLYPFQIDPQRCRTLIEMEISELQNKLQSICGTGYADPNSSIHKAYEAYNAVHNANQWVRDLECEYQKCEHTRMQQAEVLENLSKEIDKLRNDGHKDILMHLLVDQYFFRHEYVIKDSNTVRNLQTYINTADGTIRYSNRYPTYRSDPRIRFSEMLQILPQLHGVILEILYHAYGENSDDLHWAEHHCGEFLNQIQEICLRLQTNSKSMGHQKQ